MRSEMFAVEGYLRPIIAGTYVEEIAFPGSPA